MSLRRNMSVVDAYQELIAPTKAMNMSLSTFIILKKYKKK